MRYTVSCALLAAACALAQAQDCSRYRIRGQDVTRGPFAGELELHRAADGSLQVERRVEFARGTREVLRGPAVRRGDAVRAWLRASQGLAGGLSPDGSAAPEVLLRLRLDPRGATLRTQCRVGGRPVSQGAGELSDRGVEGYDPDPSPPRPRGGADVVREEGAPSLEGTRAEGYTWFRGVPFVTGEGDDRPVHPNDVKQKGLAHCYFAGALIAIAHTDPEWIESLIRDHHDGSFTVSFRGVHAGGKDAQVRIDDKLPFRTDGEGNKIPAFIPFLDQETSTIYDPFEGGETRYVFYELWPQLIEKAWAVHKGGYEQIEWSRASRVFDAVSGIKSRTYECQELSGAQIEAALAKARAEGHPTALGSKGDMGDAGYELGLVGVHTYVLWSVEGDGRAQLYNAWASSHPARSLTGDEIKACFNRIYVGGF